MSINTKATFLCKSWSAGLLLTFLLTYDLIGICNGQLRNLTRISGDPSSKYPEVIIPQGKLRGINMTTRYNRTVFGFLGIPYAQPPIGDLRFKAPKPPRSWKGTLNASVDSPSCIQNNEMGKIVGDENCLYLNTYTPQLPSRDNSTLLPVMVYIVGGRFRSGNNSIGGFGPGFLLDEDLLLVVPNYRLGVLGFLTTGDKVSPGNYGLKDMVRALQWVQDNIKYFGGDPNRVSLVGGSSGAMSVHILALSKLTDGLFHRYITQSGSAFSNSVNQPQKVSVDRTYQLANHFGCPTNTTTHLVNCLRRLKASRIVDTYQLFYEWGVYPINIWLPTVEPDIKGALLTDTPANLHTAGEIRDFPWIATVNKDEGLTYAMAFYDTPQSFDLVLENIDSILPCILEYTNIVDDVPAYTAALKSYYLNDLTANKTLLRRNFTQLIGDAKFVYPMYKAVKQRFAFAKNPQFFGSFEFRGTHSVAWYWNNSTNRTGVPHGDELVYLFGYRNERFGPHYVQYDQADSIMIDTMVQLWTSFVINGAPRTNESISTTVWQKYSSRNNYLRIGNDRETGLEMKYNLYFERMQFWEELSRATSTSGQSRSTLQVLFVVLCLGWILYF